MVTDHKPLIPLFSTKHLEELPVRVQRFRFRMQRFDFDIIHVHVPGKNLVIADEFSRAPLMPPDQLDEQLDDEIQVYVDKIIQDLPVTEQRLVEIQRTQENDPLCQEVA